MEALTQVRARRFPHHVFVSVRQAHREPAGPGLIGAQAAWLALASAWLELGVIVGHRLLFGQVSRVTHRFNHDYITFGFLAHLAVFAAWWVIDVRLRRRLRAMRPDPDRILTTVAWTLAFASPLLAVEQVYWPCSVLLAAGLAARISPAWIRLRRGVLRRTLPALIASSAMLAAGAFAVVHTAERRALASLPTARGDAPDVVLVVLDTVRADHLSVYGYDRDTTPNLRALAARSVRFDLARAPAPWTLPSHASMFTGRWPHELSADIDLPLDTTYPTLAGFLSEHGYATAGFTGNTIYTNAWFGVDRGFAHYEDSVENRTISAQEVLRSAALLRRLEPLAVRAGLFERTGRFARRKRAEEIRGDALRWLDGRPADRPFFLFLNFFDAHDPYVIPEGHPARFCRQTPLEVLRANRLYFHHMGPGGNPALAAEHTRVVMDVYDDCLRYLDDQIGRLVADLEARAMARDTWIIITADHGEHFGEHGQHGHGSSLYRPAIDVPLLIVPPDGIPARRVAEPVSPREIAATVAEVAGLAGSSPFPGRSLRRFWVPDAAAGPAAAETPLSEMKPGSTQSRGLFRTRHAAYSAALVAGSRVFHMNPDRPDELYDLSDRPESTDLAPRPELAGELRSLRALGQRLVGDR